eukprot:2624454-Rhodomonas_salina.1
MAQVFCCPPPPLFSPSIRTLKRNQSGMPLAGEGSVHGEIKAKTPHSWYRLSKLYGESGVLPLISACRSTWSGRTRTAWAHVTTPGTPAPNSAIALRAVLPSCCMSRRAKYAMPSTDVGYRRATGSKAGYGATVCYAAPGTKAGYVATACYAVRGTKGWYAATRRHHVISTDIAASPPPDYRADAAQTWLHSFTFHSALFREEAVWPTRRLGGRGEGWVVAVLC